jgi:hypothetical protein
MKKVAFIMSAGHSGSSLLSLILGSHPKVFSTGELKGLPNRYRKNLYIDCVNKDSKFWIETFGHEGVKKLASSLSGKRVHSWIPLKIEKWLRGLINSEDPIVNPYSFMFSKISEEVIVDSSKALPWIQKRLHSREFTQRMLEPYLIYLIRDGRAVINSYLRKYPSKDIIELSRSWAKKHLEKNSFFAEFPKEKKLEIRYEELACDPFRIVKEICDFLAIDFQEEMLNYWEYPHYDISGNKGTYSLIDRYKALNSERFEEKRDIDYYKKMGLSIKLDLRWKEELSEEKITVFNDSVGLLNKPYEWNE